MCIWYCHFDASWLFCPLVDADSSFCWCSLAFGMFLEWLVLLFLSMFSVSFRSSCKAGLVAMKSLSTCLSVKDFISPSLMKFTFFTFSLMRFLSFVHWESLEAAISNAISTPKPDQRLTNCFLERCGFAMLPRQISNSWPQPIFPS